MTDFLLLERLHRMILDIPKPRLMFKKGVCVKGFFRPYMSFSEYTEAEIFKSIDEITPVIGRFSSMLGDRGTADTVRNIKGFSVKFRSGEGDYDLICQNLPVYFINYAEKFPQLAEALTVKESFDRINSEKFWEFTTSNPEAINCALRLFSNEGLSDSYIYEKWFSVNTYIWKNSKGEKFLVRYNWVPIIEDSGCFNEQSRKMDRIFAEFIAGFEPDRATEVLERFVADGCFPSFELQVQVVGHKYIAHPNYLKRTMCWNEKLIPPISMGTMKITEVDIYEDAVGFCPGNTIRGIEISGDEFAMIMNHAHSMGAAERGIKL